MLFYCQVASRLLNIFILSVLLLLSSESVHLACAEVTVTIDRHLADQANKKFDFKNVAIPSATDAGVLAKLKLVVGEHDRNGAAIKALNDGHMPTDEDQPSGNWFLAGTRPGRLLVDFGKPINLKEIRSYSWHPNWRADQVYSVYVPKTEIESASELTDSIRSATNEDALSAIWTRVVEVDSRDNSVDATQIAVSVADASQSTLALARHVLLVIRPTADDRYNSQTFFSEIDFIDGQVHQAPPEPEKRIDVLQIDGFATISFDSTETPSLRPWITKTLMPACKVWYPRIVKALPSDGFSAPSSFKIVFRDSMRGVAYTSGKDVYCAGPWYRRNLRGEATGSVIHELVHVVQQYGRSGGPRPPGWLVEGIADHIRWYQYEPKDQRRKINWQNSNYDKAYFPSATFLDYIVRKIDPNAIRQINADAREGKVREGYWINKYDKTAEEIWQSAKEEATGGT